MATLRPTSTTLPVPMTTSIPLTTFSMPSVFTPPSSCSNSWTYEPEAANSVIGGLLIQNAAPNDNADPACFPSDFDQYGRKTAAAVFSPGFCPVGYTSADVAVDQPITTAVCCLSQFTYFTETMENGKAVYAGCTRLLPSTTSTIVTIRQSPGHSTQVTGPITMWAQPITVELQASDLARFDPESITVGESTTTASHITAPLSTSSPATSSAQPTTTQQPHPHSISTGAGIGIGVGVGIAGLGIIGVVAFWLYRRRRMARVSATNAAYHVPYRDAQPMAKERPHASPLELEGTQGSSVKTIPELYG